MNLKHLFYTIACLILVIALFSCNSDSEYKVDGDISTEGRLIGFSVSAKPYTAIDSITYPVLNKTKFTIENKSVYDIFNVDSLPVGTDIRTLMVELTYASETHLRTDLVYPSDSIVEWNETDSVKFIKVKETGKYYPEFRVIAPSGLNRDYSVDFNIHKQDPDSIKWEDAGFALKVKGETKVILNADKSKFIAFTNNGTNVYCYTSPVESPTWRDITQTGETLPATTLVKSLQTTDEIYVLITNDGVAYTSPIAETLTWTKHDAIKIRSIVGLLPEVAATRATPLNEFLITYSDGTTARYAKTSDFETLSPIELQGVYTDDRDLVEKGFPIINYSSLLKSSNGDTFTILVGGKDKKDEGEEKEDDNAFVKKSWIIKNVSLGTPAKISIMPSVTSNVVPFDTQITSFLYDDKVYAISSDSLSLYYSKEGYAWTKASLKQKLDEKMANMNLPSVVVDKDNYMWVFGGVSNKTSVYSQQIWRGRINRLAPKK